MNDLKRPSSDFVTNIYAACLQQVTTLSADSLQGPVQRELAKLDSSVGVSLSVSPVASHPGLFCAGSLCLSDGAQLPLIPSASILHVITYVFLRSRNFSQRFAGAAKISDFSSRDMSHPEPERTRANLSAFINLTKFSEQRAEFIEGLRQKSSRVNAERRKVVDELEEAQQKVATIRAKLKEDEPRCEELRKENEEITDYLHKCRDQQMELFEKVKSLKQERSALIQRKEGVRADIEQVNEHISRTRSRIVQSPDRIRNNIKTMTTAAAEDKRAVSMRETKIRDLQTKIAALQTIENNVKSCVEQLQAIEKEVQQLDLVKKGLSDLKDQLNEKKGERSELLLKRERVHKQLANAQEKLERAQKHAEDKRAASQQTLERLQREYDEMAEERKDNDRQVEELRDQADDIERKMAEHMKQSQNELNELLTEYWKLRYATEVYMETLANKLGMQVTET
ncbi:hypothetical protein EIP86_011524 [Pleurotus ostreatoroseus]|nr:hypothetical protein EIP86_011524 [Pleurotus ostreatoroseus]